MKQSSNSHSNSSIKILHLITSLEVGGAQHGLLLGLPRLDPERYEHIVCSLMNRIPMAGQFRESGVEVHSLGLSRRTDLSVVLRLRRLMKKIKPDIKVYGAEPEEANDAYRSVIAGRRLANQTTNTICDGLRAQIGEINFPIIQKMVDGIITVAEQDIIDSMRIIWERMKIIVEPSSSIALAAIIKNMDGESDPVEATKFLIQKLKGK